LGAHSKPSRVRLPQAASAAAAAPTLAGVAAAFCLAPTASAAAAVVPVASTAGGPAASTASDHNLAVPAAYQKAGKPVHLLAASKPATSHKVATARSYTVRSGDSLSAIAGHFYHNANAWPVIFYGNRGKIRWANDINVGQVLTIPAKSAHIPRPPAQLSPQSYTPRHARAATVTAEVQPTTTSTSGYYAGGPYPGGAFGACVVARESGGNPQIWNASGHYGLYQFSESTWIAYGGSPAEFGHATVAEQNAVFATALAEGGQDNWAPYDGC
jgi:LysM repeat protein